MTALSFTPERIEQIKAGAKTQTRRPVKEGEFAEHYRDAFRPNDIYQVWTKRDGAVKSTLKWRVGCTRAIKPGRTAAGVGRVRITGIRRERVDEISEAGAFAEGFSSKDAFLAAWIEMYGTASIQRDCWALEFEYEEDVT